VGLKRRVETSEETGGVQFLRVRLNAQTVAQKGIASGHKKVISREQDQECTRAVGGPGFLWKENASRES
jgi:hypothetical protein